MVGDRVSLFAALLIMKRFTRQCLLDSRSQPSGAIGPAGHGDDAKPARSGSNQRQVQRCADYWTALTASRTSMASSSSA
jgi:hypothetical protein